MLQLVQKLNQAVVIAFDGRDDVHLRIRAARIGRVLVKGNRADCKPAARDKFPKKSSLMAEYLAPAGRKCVVYLVPLFFVSG